MILLASVVACIFVSAVWGQCDDATRPLEINATYFPQYITSPNYPNDYPENQDCAWLVSAPSPTDRILINMEDVAAEGTNIPCIYDYVSVHDGDDDTATELAKLCNGNKNSVDVLVSSNDSLYIVFVSDHRFNYKGFRMMVFTNDSAYQPNCDNNSTFTATSEAQVLMSPNLPDPYQSDFVCGIRIKPDTWYYAVKLEMYFMDIESSENCTHDALQIISVDNPTTTEELVQCSRASTYYFSDFPLEVAGDHVLLNFSTDSSNSFYGFLLTYSEVPRGINLTSPANGSTTRLTLREDQATGHINTSVAFIELTYTGTLEIQIWPSYEVNGNQTVNLQSDVQIFALTDDEPYLYLDLISSLDYEIITKFSLVVTLVDTDVSQMTYSLTYNVTITDVDDVKPTFLSLPSNVTVMRNQKAGEVLHIVNATDYDASIQFRNILYQIFDGDLDSTFTIDETTGELKLSKNANLIPLTTTEYILIIAAYSGTSTASALAEFSTFTVYVDPDSPPECTKDNVWAEILDLNMVGQGHRIKPLQSWSCSDDNYNLTYTIESVSPNLTSPLFEVDSDTGAVTLLRRFTATEVPGRMFAVEIGVTDTVDQLVTFTLSVNVTALTCLPNPRKLYVRMDHDLDGVLVDDFNCTHRYGLDYTLDQYPEGTFAVDDSVNGSAKLILKNPVEKMKFYGLSVSMTDGLDSAVLKFQVIVQTARCGISRSSSAVKTSSNFAAKYLFYVNIFFIYLILN